MIREGIRLAVEGKALTTQMAREIMDEMMSRSATPSQVGSFITAMRMKGETTEELLGFVTAMREKARKISAPAGAVDLCGTGGDGRGTFNISTISSFVVAGAGVPVAKHGNRAISSKCGSADMIAALGIPFDLEPSAVETCLQRTGIGFMFAPKFHESMKNVMDTRQEIGIRTFFNILGPMSNPAGVKHQLVGVFDPALAPTIARVLRDLGTQRAMIVHGEGMDEVTNIGVTKVTELSDGATREYEISPDTFGLDTAEPAEIAGGSAMFNARATMSILKGEMSRRSDIVAMNSAAALYVAGKATTLQEGFRIAMDSVKTGRALAKLKEFADVARQLEAQTQEHVHPSSIRSRNILPETLKRRYPEICSSILAEILLLDGGRACLHGLDDELISRPSILSVLVLNRVSRILSDKQPLPDPRERSGVSLSGAISSARGIAIIGEYKPGSPSYGALMVPPDPQLAADIYGRAGVAAVSVLAEPDFFRGGTDLFATFRSKLNLPLLFKDFVVTERQIAIAERLGADAVLLIAKALKLEHLNRLIRYSVSKGIEPLVEIHDDEDLHKLMYCGSYDLVKTVGVNSRDLRTLEVDDEKFGRLRGLVGTDKQVVAESGVRSTDDVSGLRGCDAVLIGSMFMQSDDLEKTVKGAVLAASAVRR